MIIREKKIDCGNYREIDIIPRPEAERKGRRIKRHRITAPKQQELNDKNAKRYLVQLGNGNFGQGDYHITCTYKVAPESVEDAEKKVRKYLDRIAYRRKVMGLDPLKYILVTEYKYARDGTTIRRVHHHIIVNGGMDRDLLELMWTENRINWKKIEDPQYRKSISMIGYCNVDRIQPGENGIEALCRYLVKDPQGKKRWSSSRNLERPVLLPPADRKYRRRQIENVAKSTDGGKEFFQKQFPDWIITSIEPIYYEETGWHIYLKMWRKKAKRGRSVGNRKKRKKLRKPGSLEKHR